MTRMLRLESHAAIRLWVSHRDGQPAMAMSWDERGYSHPNLALVFRGRPLPPPETRERNVMPCSWKSWFAELDRRRLVLEVVDDDADEIHETDISYVDRSRFH